MTQEELATVVTNIVQKVAPYRDEQIKDLPHKDKKSVAERE